MGFFDDVPAPEPEWKGEPGRPPDWVSPPEWTAPGVVALELVLAQTDAGAVLLDVARVWPTGVEFEVYLLEHGDLEERGVGPPVADGLLGDDLRFGLQFADGRRVTNLTDGFGGPEDEPSEPLLTSQGGGGGGSGWEERLWLWPLPPAGPLLLVCEWPAAGIAETHVEIDAGPLLVAAQRAKVIWEDDRPLWSDDQGWVFPR